jgi:DNA mismatch repair protein MutS2
MQAASRAGWPDGEPTLDLHGLRLSEAVSRTNAFLLREQARGTLSARIVTGHGTGVLKSAVREMLAKHPAVALARPALGTDAVTLVVLRPTQRLRADQQRR